MIDLNSKIKDLEKYIAQREKESKEDKDKLKVTKDKLIGREKNDPKDDLGFHKKGAKNLYMDIFHADAVAIIPLVFRCKYGLGRK